MLWWPSCGRKRPGYTYIRHFFFFRNTLPDVPLHYLISPERCTPVTVVDIACHYSVICGYSPFSPSSLEGDRPVKRKASPCVLLSGSLTRSATPLISFSKELARSDLPFGRRKNVTCVQSIIHAGHRSENSFCSTGYSIQSISLAWRASGVILRLNQVSLNLPADRPSKPLLSRPDVTGRPTNSLLKYYSLSISTPVLLFQSFMISLSIKNRV